MPCLLVCHYCIFHCSLLPFEQETFWIFNDLFRIMRIPNLFPYFGKFSYFQPYDSRKYHGHLQLRLQNMVNKNFKKIVLRTIDRYVSISGIFLLNLHKDSQTNGNYILKTVNHIGHHVSFSSGQSYTFRTSLSSQLYTNFKRIICNITV